MGEHVTEIDVRFRDLDPMGHVNNAVYASYLEQARARYFDDVVGTPLGDFAVALVHLSIDFERPIEFGEPVSVRTAVTGLGRTSLTMAYEVVAAGEPAASAETVQVFRDPETGRASELPDRVRERVTDFDGLEA